MKLRELINRIEEAFPTSESLDWDNVGLLCGDRERSVKKVLLTLDVTEETVKEAVFTGCDLILSHHPILFSPAKRINSDTYEGRLLMSAIENKISIYSAHTNCDIAKGGINTYLARLFELENVEALEENGLGRIGNLKNPVSLYEFSSLVCKKLNTPFVRTSQENRTIRRLAIGSGACADSIPTAISKGADAMLSSDIKYHEMLSFSPDISIIDAGHYPTEIIVTDIFAQLLKDFPIEVVKSKQQDVFKLIKGEEK